MNRQSINFSTDIHKSRNTQVVHGTDAYKEKQLITDVPVIPKIPKGLKFELSHGTSSNKYKITATSHGVDSFKRLIIIPGVGGDMGSEGDVLGGQINLPSTTTNSKVRPELSKNSPTYISIGDGVSVMVGLPRIATWNTPGRPKRPPTGTMGFNTQTKCLETWNGSAWYTVAMQPLN